MANSQAQKPRNTFISTEANWTQFTFINIVALQNRINEPIGDADYLNLMDTFSNSLFKSAQLV